MPFMQAAVSNSTFAILWRSIMTVFRINPASMTPRKLGFQITDPQDLDRATRICETFAGGYNAMISDRRDDGWLQYVDSLPRHYKPFAAEGAAMGFSLGRTLAVSPKCFETELVKANDQYCHLQYVGLGFWLAMRRASVGRICRVVDQIDPMHGPLCWDGYGFKFGFFNYDKQARWRRRFAGLPGYARNVAYQGLGRSLWFRFMGEPESLVREIRAVGQHDRDIAAGTGLAIVFTQIDRLERAAEALALMPDAWRGDVLLGMTFAFKARSINDPIYFESLLNGMDDRRAAAVLAAIYECDRIEHEIRHDGAIDGYQRWRETLTGWLRQNVEYPFLALREAGRTASEREMVSIL